MQIYNKYVAIGFSRNCVILHEKVKRDSVKVKEEDTLELERLEDASAADKATSLPGRASASSQREGAYAALSRRIIQFELDPAERITEPPLASETGLGETPVRAPLR